MGVDYWFFKFISCYCVRGVVERCCLKGWHLALMGWEMVGSVDLGCGEGWRVEVASKRINQKSCC